MAEKKENSKNFDINFFKQYIELIKKYCLKLLKLDPQTYFFIVPGILLLVGLLPVPDIYFAIIFAMIAIIYNPIFFISFGNEEINTGPIIFVLTIALFVLGYNKIKD